MKILAINCSPDLSYFAQKGLNYELTCVNLILPKFPIKFLYTGKDGNGQPFDLYTPDVTAYLEENYKAFQYSIILVGWNPSDYGDNVKRTGGYTCPTPLTCGSVWTTVRQDTPANNLYPVHEIMHCLCEIINIIFGDHAPKDFMDNTLVNGQWLPYYINDPNSTDPNSNFNQTWKGISPFLGRLNDATYVPVVTLTRTIFTAMETIGELRTEDGKFGCDTLERPVLNNQPNISAIPKGTYTCKWRFMWKQMRYRYQIMDVPNRSGIFLHAGSFFFNLLGCISLGSLPQDINKDGQLDLINSNLILNSFETLLAKKDFILIIK